MRKEFSNQKKIEENLNSIFNNKGIFSAVGEKSINNFKTKFIENQLIQPNLHYFAVGHTFKNIDTKQIFDYQLTDDEKDQTPTKFLKLQQSNFDFSTNGKLKDDELWKVVENIRNINAHYIHKFDFIELKNIDKDVINFIKESFELAIIMGAYAKHYGKLKTKRKVDFLSNEDKNNILIEILNNLDNQLIQFLKEIFYQSLYTKKDSDWGGNAEYYAQKKQFLDSYLTTKQDWIDWVLFNDVEEDFEWELNSKGDNSTNNHKHKVLNIKKGKYLSFEGCLFIMTMFLYANEANYLIPKLKGFKKNKDPQDAAKLEVFRFYAKKFKSQDVESNSKHFVKFRDMVQYLGKYPTTWNNVLHLDKYDVNFLKNAVLENEIIKMYQDDIKNFFEDKYGNKIFEENINDIHKAFLKVAKAFFDTNALNLSGEYYDDCKTILTTSAEFLDYQRQSKNIYHQLKKFKDSEWKLLSPDEKTKKKELDKSKQKLKANFVKVKRNKSKNLKTEKLKNRIQENLLVISRGRNNDRFMEFSTRFLAEINYFGENAKFKMYENYYSDEERLALEQKEEILDDKTFDKLHYHGGKLTHFFTYQDHLNKHPDWDMPFVIQNNAIYVKISGIEFQKNESFCIQRNMLNYLVEHALSDDYKDGHGKEILIKYFHHKNNALKEAKQLLSDEDKSIDKSKKKELKKLLPKRLLHHYCPPENGKENKENIFKKYLDKAQEEEGKYEAQKQMAINEKRLDLFLNKNKGKQFKLQFIFRAWQLMFLREQYEKQKARNALFQRENSVSKNNEHELGHHKKYNITRKEYDLFSKWMYALDEVPEYKKQLEILLNDKNLFENSAFDELFKSASNLDDFYVKTKSIFKEWLATQRPKENENRFHLKNYKKMMEVGNFHINLSHFLDFAAYHNIVKKQGSKIKRPITKHAKYLYQKYYHIDLNHPDAFNTEKNMFRKLYKNRLEDCLLYEIALRYLQPNTELRENSYEHISQLFNQDVSISVEARNSQKYTVQVPFKDLEKFAQLKNMDDQHSNKYSLFRRLPEYLAQVNQRRENVHQVKDMIKDFEQNKIISLAHLSTLNNHLITQQGRFTNCILAMEEYYIWQNEYKIEQEDERFNNRIDIKKMPVLSVYFENDNSRNNAFHMDLPLDQTYKSAFKQIEKVFVENEVKKANYKSLDDCPYMLKKTLLIFMGQMHDEIKMKFNNKDSEDERKAKRKYSENEYFKSLFYEK